MDDMLSSMLEKYDCKTPEDYKNALKELLQELTLFALSKSDFYQKAAFYGGTALRIFYGLDRFSEDLDFSLKKPSDSFSLKKFMPLIQSELGAYGFRIEVYEKKKSRTSAVQSGFVKGNTIVQMLHVFPDFPIQWLHRDEVVKVKFEIDTDPPAGAAYEQKFSLLPVPYAVMLYDKPSLFAGKMHAVLCRKWKHRNKGRDVYDYVWYLSTGTAVNIPHLQKRMEQTGDWGGEDVLTIDTLKHLLYERFHSMDFEAAKQDVLPFIHDTAKLSLWSADFFCAITDQFLREEGARKEDGIFVKN